MYRQGDCDVRSLFFILLTYQVAWMLINPLFMTIVSALVERRCYDGNNGNNTQHIDNISPATLMSSGFLILLCAVCIFEYRKK